MLFSFYPTRVYFPSLVRLENRMNMFYLHSLAKHLEQDRVDLRPIWIQDLGTTLG